MATPGFSLRIDTAGLGEVLKGPEMREVIGGLAGAIAADVDGYDHRAEGVTRPYTSDRAGVTVVFVHPDSMDLQTRDGVLTRAAARQGLEVRRRR